MDFREYFQFEIKEIEADKIEEIKDFPIGERILHKQDEVSGYHETFLWRHEYVQAGISDANVLALFYTMYHLTSTSSKNTLRNTSSMILAKKMSLH